MILSMYVCMFVCGIVSYFDVALYHIHVDLRHTGVEELNHIDVGALYHTDVEELYHKSARRSSSIGISSRSCCRCGAQPAMIQYNLHTQYDHE